MALCYDPKEAIKTLSKADKKLEKLMKKVGGLDIDPPARLNPFEALLRSIVYQQLSGKAASTIHGRVKALFPGRTIKPTDVLTVPDDTLRGAGMSRAKIAARLIQVRGIGEWTVQMVLMFQLGRPDVLPVKDLGVRKGFMITYNLSDMPTEKEMAAYCECWRPFRSVASWYMWRAVDLANEK